MSAATTDATAIAADGHTYGRLDGHKDTWTDPNCIVIKNIFYQKIRLSGQKNPTQPCFYFNPFVSNTKIKWYLHIIREFTFRNSHPIYIEDITKLICNCFFLNFILGLI